MDTRDVRDEVRRKAQELLERDEVVILNNRSSSDWDTYEALVAEGFAERVEIDDHTVSYRKRQSD